MSYLIVGLVVFTAVHLVPSAPALRAVLVGRLGLGGYKAVFSLVSLVGIVLVVVGLKRVEYVQWYAPPTWGRDALLILMLPALYLFLSNSRVPAPSSARYFTANPANWSVVLWAGGHLLANGDRAHVIMFGTFFVFALVSIATGRYRNVQPSLSRRPPLAKELVFVAIVIAAYAGLFAGHGYFSGVPLR